MNALQRASVFSVWVRWTGGEAYVKRGVSYPAAQRLAFPVAIAPLRSALMRVMRAGGLSLDSA